jgi:spermidine dehydrogenase
LIGYGGSQSIQSPKTLWSDVAKGLLRDLGVEISRFDSAFDRGFYSSRGLSRGVFFDRETFGRDTLVTGDALLFRGADAGPQLANFIASMPIADASKRQLLSLYDPARDPLPSKSPEEKAKILKATSYRDYLVKICGCSNQVANCFQGRPLGFFGLGCDAVAAFDLRSFGYPGFAGLKLPDDDHPEWASRTFIISPTEMLRWRAFWCARSFSAPGPGTQWMTSCSPASTMARLIVPATTCAFVCSRRSSM